MINDGKMIVTLRHTNYNAMTAAADIVDNSLDAGASKIEIDTELAGSSLQRVLFADNGGGMTSNELTEAFKIGSERPYDNKSDLGCFGVGLITASINQGKRLTVITKKAGKYSFGQLDIDEIVDAGEYHISQRRPTDEERNLLDAYIEEDSGTLVMWEKLDRCTYKSGNGFINAIRRHFAITFRDLIKKNKIKFRIGGRLLRPVDPIRDYDHIELLNKEVQLSEGVNVKMSMYFLGDNVKGNQAVNLKFQSHFCGFSVMRNSREISRSSELGLFKRSTDLRRFRGVIELTADADRIIKTDFQKTNVEFSEEDRTILEDLVKQGLKEFRIQNAVFLEAGRKEKDETKPIVHSPGTSTVTNIGLETPIKESKSNGVEDVFLNRLNLLLEEFGLQGKYEEFVKIYKK